MNPRNKFLIVLAIILAASTAYYFISTPRSSDLVLIGTVDANQIIVSPQMQGRIAKLLVDACQTGRPNRDTRSLVT